MSTTKQKKTCTTCSKELFGRKDKVFCNNTCKNKHHRIAKLQIAEDKDSDNNVINRNIVILEGLMGKSTKGAEIHYSKLFKVGFDLKSFSERIKHKGKTYLKIGSFLFKLLSNDFVEIIRISPIRRYLKIFFQRWDVIFKDWEEGKIHEKKDENWVKRLSFF